MWNPRFADGENAVGTPSEGDIDRLDHELSQKNLAPHLAFFYRSPETQLKVAATFVRRGLRTGNRCLYYIDSSTEERLRTALEAVGIDVAARVDAGDLLIRRGTEAYHETDFRPEGLISALERACHESVSEEYSGLWVAGEVSWCFHTDLSYDHVIDFEAEFDATCPDLPITALCQYDLNQFNEESVVKALWTHEQIIYRYTICENPYYVPPAKYRTAADQPLNTQLMLEQIYDLGQARQETEQHKERLSVINRVLRHNIRNDLNVIRGVVDLIAQNAQLDDGHQEQVSTALKSADEVVEIADKARFVEQTIDASTVTRVDLWPVLTGVREQVNSIYPDAQIVLEGDEETSVVADENIDKAFNELVLYALGKQEATPPKISVAVTERSPERICVDIRYSGAPIPENDRKVLAEGAETQLDHCDGLGLWLAKWIIENGEGKLTFPDTEQPQIRVVLQLTR